MKKKSLGVVWDGKDLFGTSVLSAAEPTGGLMVGLHLGGARKVVARKEFFPPGTQRDEKGGKKAIAKKLAVLRESKALTGGSSLQGKHSFYVEKEEGESRRLSRENVHYKWGGGLEEVIILAIWRGKNFEGGSGVKGYSFSRKGGQVGGTSHLRFYAWGGGGAIKMRLNFKTRTT